MMHPGDLQLFLLHHANANALANHDRPRSAEIVLATSRTGLLGREIWHLARAVKLAAAVGDASEDAAAVATRIAEAARSGAFAALAETDAWTEAISWAILDLQLQPPRGFALGPSREQEVAQACLRLRKRGYKVGVDAFGYQIDPATRGAIARRINGLMAIIGGRNALVQLFRILRETGRIHDGMWLFGNQVAGIGQQKSPTQPFGWLISLALKHTARSAASRKPEKAWKNAMALSADFAAVADVERYGQFESMIVEPADLAFVIQEAIGWQQWFTQPQATLEVICRIDDALKQLLTAEDVAKLGSDFWSLITELRSLLSQCAAERPSIFGRTEMERATPTLMKVAFGRVGKVNAGFVEPSDTAEVDHDQVALFEVDRDNVLVLPRSLASASAASVIVRRLWARLPAARAKKVVGQLFEHVVEQACRAKAADVVSDIGYRSDRKELQIDVAVKEEQQLTMFEVKAKSLTDRARSGDVVTFLNDYAKSYLALVLQLARHERSVLDGHTTLATINEARKLNVTKVAVSPLSFGPFSDRALTRSTLSALAVAKLAPGIPDERAADVLRGVEQAILKLVEQVRPMAQRTDGLLDLQSYMLGFYWLDIGELLYVLRRSGSVAGALRPLRHMTFVSRDVWTEIAFADRMGLSAKDWRPVE